MRYTGPKARLCRREGVNLFGAPKYQKILGDRSGVPGMHGGKRTGKLSEYGKQLREKQKAKRMYGLSERQFKKYVLRAIASREVTGDAFFRQLETRLDNVIYRAGFASTRAQARQFVSHGLFEFNGRRVDVPSIQVRPGDIITVRSSRQSSPIFKQNFDELKDVTPPSWLKTLPKQYRIEIEEEPGAKHFEYIVESRLIVEFYSR